MCKVVMKIDSLDLFHTCKMVGTKFLSFCNCTNLYFCVPVLNLTGGWLLNLMVLPLQGLPLPLLLLHLCLIPSPCSSLPLNRLTPTMRVDLINFILREVEPVPE